MLRRISSAPLPPLLANGIGRHNNLIDNLVGKLIFQLIQLKVINNNCSRQGVGFHSHKHSTPQNIGASSCHKMAGDGISDMIKPFSWIIGNWESTKAQGSFPTIKDFTYNEKLAFRVCGQQPLLAYSGSSSHPVNGNPMHLESGFLRSRGDGNVSFMVAHNFGLATVEEGKVSGKSISLSTTSVGRMTGSSETAVVRIDRKFTLQDDETLLQEMAMSTSKTPTLTDHLKAVYKRSA